MPIAAQHQHGSLGSAAVHPHPPATFPSTLSLSLPAPAPPASRWIILGVASRAAAGDGLQVQHIGYGFAGVLVFIVLRALFIALGRTCGMRRRSRSSARGSTDALDDAAVDGRHARQGQGQGPERQIHGAWAIPTRPPQTAALSVIAARDTAKQLRLRRRLAIDAALSPPPRDSAGDKDAICVICLEALNTATSTSTSTAAAVAAAAAAPPSTSPTVAQSSHTAFPLRLRPPPLPPQLQKRVVHDGEDDEDAADGDDDHGETVSWSDGGGGGGENAEASSGDRKPSPPLSVSPSPDGPDGSEYMGMSRELAHGRCKHVMHRACLRAWLVKDVSTSCPVCRTPVLTPGSVASLCASPAALPAVAGGTVTPLDLT